MALNNQNNHVSETINLGSLAATAIVPGIYFSKRVAIKGAYLINGAALTVDPTNNAIVELQDNNGGGSPIGLAKIDTSQAGQGLLADIAAPLLSEVAPLAGSVGGNPPATGYPLDIAAGKSLQVSYTKGGTGSLTNAKLVVEYYVL